MSDGVGYLTLDKNDRGTLPPIVHFNHTLTPENGYTIYDTLGPEQVGRFQLNTPYYTSNSTLVDYNSIDFSSQISLDPNSNVTLPSKPKISLFYEEESPQTATTTPVPTTPSSPTSPSPQSQQPAQTAPPVTTQPTTPSSPSTSGVIIDRPTAARLAAEDPYFARFEQILANCNNLVSGTATITLEQCVTSLQDGADRWCGLEFYDALKCEYASFMVQQYNKIQGTLGGNLFNDLFLEGLLAPTP